MTVRTAGEITFPPPPIQKISAAPKPQPDKPELPSGMVEELTPKPWWISFGLVAAPRRSQRSRCSPSAPPAFVRLFGIFALALVVGYYVVWV